MIDTWVHDYAGNAEYQIRFAFLPRVGENIWLGLAEQKREHAVLRIWYDESPDEQMLWIPQLEVKRVE